jgi:molecular chaperone GrpE
MTDPDPVAVLADAVELLRQQLDHVHRRNDELVAEARSRADEPLIRDLVMVTDTCARTAREWQERDTAEPADVATALSNVAQDLTLVLERAGVEAFQPEPGEAFERRVARAVRREPGEEGCPGGRVLAVVRPGYRSGERVIRYAEVVVSE